MSRNMNARSHFTAMMDRGEQPYGIFVSSIDPAVTDILGGAGFDFVVIDGEHGRNDRNHVENHVRAAGASGVAPFVRVLENSPALIQSMLDVGAHGIVVPHVDTAKDARQAVDASRYAPRGRRGMCPACNSGGYTLDGWIGRTRNADDNIMIIPILESRKSIENVEEILAVDGIDLVLFGPGDLSADMGLDLTTDIALLMDAWGKVLAAARAAGKYILAPTDFGLDEANMLIAPMEYMLLHKLASSMVADHKDSGHQTAKPDK
jgi:4-hydroxy-2-oxoheptanedioate aldolase